MKCRALLSFALVFASASFGCSSAEPSALAPPGSAPADASGVSLPPRGLGADVADAAPAPVTLPSRVSADVVIDEVAIFQGVKRTLFSRVPRDASVPKPPAIERRDALVRVYVTPPGGVRRHVDAALLLRGGHGGHAKLLTATAYIDGASDERRLETTLNFRIGGADLAKGTSIAVAILGDRESPEGTPSTARYPADAKPAELPLERVSPLVVRLVPLRYDADGSGRLPDLGPKYVDDLRSAMLRIFPVPSVDVSVAAPEPVAKADNDTFLKAVKDAAAKEPAQYKSVYHLGLYLPTAIPTKDHAEELTFGIPGIGYALGFDDPFSLQSALRSTGLSFGLGYSDCGDSYHPWSTQNGLTDVGYDIVTGKLIDPEFPHRRFSVMSFCSPVWIGAEEFKLAARLMRQSSE